MADDAGEAEKGQMDYDIVMADEYVLNEVEKNFILAAEHGDVARVRRIIEDYKGDQQGFNLNCVDPLNRSALISAIENENFELIVCLLEAGIDVGDALLHAISEEYVEAVEELLQWEETHHQEGQPYSWEAVDRSKCTFTPDITPLILAAHRNNYEILKVLLDRGATLPMPHDVKCGCDDCVTSQETDSLRHSQSRINAFRALSASSLIALSSRDPVLTAFELSWELKRLQAMESEFRAEYTEMRLGVQEFVSSLLDHARTSMELEVMLNFNHESTHDVWMPGQRQTLERLKLAIKYKQKAFVAHPNVQQLLAAIWYEGLPGFRRKTVSQQIMDVVKLGCMFPLNSMNYLIAPDSDKGKFMRKPFVKFISHSCSYMFFLTLLGAASLRVVQIMFELVAFPWMTAMLEDWKKHERGSLPGPIELGIIMYIFSLIFGELRSLYSDGLFDYICDLWNIVDFISNMFYVTWILCRATAWIIVHRDLWYRGIDPYFPREHWHPFDPMLLSEGAFAAGMIFSFLKLVHIFSINPHLGPLQVSLGRMIIDIIKFFFIYTLVLFAFGCGLNQLLWYYADLEKHKCYHLHPDVADFDDQEKACTIWRRFSNLFETSQSLFWASFGLVDLVSFDLAGIKSFTRFWALLMFGSYSVINIIVLLNMLIAMMSNSYQIISERADVEWKFARSQLWMSYFEDGGTVPPPFNLCPSIKLLKKTLGKETKKRTKSFMRKSKERAQALHDKVMKLLIRRFVTAEQRKRDDYGITEDDIIEVRQDISSLRFELLDIFNNNNFDVPDIEKKSAAGTKKGKVLERRIKKDFQIGFVETLTQEMNNDKSVDVFSSIAKVIGRRQSALQKGEKKDWNAIVRKNTMSADPIGSKRSSMQRRSQRSLRRQIIDQANEGLAMNTNKIVEYNPKLGDVTRATRVAYVKFMQKKLTAAEEQEDKNGEGDDDSATSPTAKPSGSVKKDDAVKKDEMTRSMKLLAAAASKGAAPNPPSDDKPGPSGVTADKPGDKAADKPGDKAADKPGDKPADKAKPVDKPKPADKPGDKPAPKPAPDAPKTADKPAAGAKPADSAKPADASKPAAGAKPEDPAKKPDASKAADAAKPTDAAKPGDKPAPAAAPADAAAKPDVAKPGEADKPDAAAKKAEDTKSDAAKSSEGTATTAKGQAPAAPTGTAPAADGTTPAAATPPEGAPKTTTAADKPSAATDTAKPEQKTDGKSDDKPADKPGDKPGGGAAGATAGGDKPADKKPPAPKPNIKVGQSSAAAGGDRGKSTVTGRMISGWL